MATRTVWDRVNAVQVCDSRLMQNAEKETKMDDVKTLEYRQQMEAQLAYDIWFMNTHSKDKWDDDFSWDKNCFPIEFGNGWLYSFYELCTKLLTEVKSDFTVQQIKEKFGGGRFYYSGGITPYGEELIRQWEVDMESVCECCGEPGKLRTDGWWKALCDKCNNESKEG